MHRSQSDLNALQRKLAELRIVLDGSRQTLILLHDNPDPDAMASGLALSEILKYVSDTKVTIAYGGLIGRAENRAMVRELKIPLKKISRLRIENYDRVALVDTQPGAGNNALPSDMHCNIVVDHHPRRRGVRSDVVIIDKSIGAVSTLLVELLYAATIEISGSLATALTYAIRSETQDLGCVSSNRDIESYFAVLPMANMRKIARITHPRRTRLYFVTLVETLKRAMTYRNLICVNIGEVPYPEVVAEMADMLLQLRRISWSFCTGRFRTDLILSLRSSNPMARAGIIITKLVRDKKAVGGHNLFAGGKIPLKSGEEEGIIKLETRLCRDFSRAMGYDTPEWKTLIGQSTTD